MGELKVLLEHIQKPGVNTLAGYQAVEGYSGLRKAVTLERQAVIDEMKVSGLRGRGGAGFPAWIKWNGMPKTPTGPSYLICNADEGEPGTFKDRELMVCIPHMVVEGMAIAGYATSSTAGYIYVRGEFAEASHSLRIAIDEAYAAGLLGKSILGIDGFDFDLYVHTGAGSYECGEETALMSSLMGERGQPRAKPPHGPLPVVAGVWRRPTVVNNVETYCAAAHILKRGGAWYAGMGTQRSAGTKIFSVSGHVAKPGNYEVELGTPLMELIELAGGVVGGALKAVIPGGSSVPILPAASCAAVNLDYESCMANGTMLGSGGFMVFNDKTDIVALMRRTAQFYAHESCGKCTPCREGTRWILRIMNRIATGKGRPEDIDLLLGICNQVDGRSYCPLGDAAVWPIRASIQRFRADYDHWIEHGRSPIEVGAVPPVVIHGGPDHVEGRSH